MGKVRHPQAPHCRGWDTDSGTDWCAKFFINKFETAHVRGLILLTHSYLGTFWVSPYLISSCQVLSKCSKEFLSDLAQQTVPALFFHGADMMEDTKDGLVFLMSGHADRISNDHKRFLSA